MDLDKYVEALDDVSEKILPKYFSNNKSQFDLSKKQLIKIFKKYNYKYLSIPQPFFISYFRKNFIFLCQNAPDFVGSVLYTNIHGRAFGIAGLAGAGVAAASSSLGYAVTYIFKSTSKETIADAENSYQLIRKKLNKIKDSSKILKRDINEVLKLIEPHSIAKNSKKALQIYYILYSELKLSLQLLYHVEDIDKTFDFNKSMFETNVPLLEVLSHANINLEKYSKNTLITSISDDLKILYNKIEQSHQGNKEYELPKPQTKGSSIVSDSTIKIKMNPFPKRKANNEIIINNQCFSGVQNAPFDLLYYLLWLRLNNPDESAGIELNGVIPLEHIKRISNNDDKFARFSADWNSETNKSNRYYKSKEVLFINKLLRTRHKIDFDAIVLDGEYYKLTNRFKPGNIELVPFDTNI